MSLVSAIYERYGEISDASSISCSINCSEFSGSTSSASCSPVASPMVEGEIGEGSSNNLPVQNQATSVNSCSAEIYFYIPPVCSPRKTQSGLVMTSVTSLIMTDRFLNNVGDQYELQNCCRNVLELDLSKNEFMDWNEIKKILNALINLRLLNLSHNPLQNSINYQSINNKKEDEEQTESSLHAVLNYFHNEWITDQHQFQQLDILILNSCLLDLRIVECLLDRMPNLNELHLSSNAYSRVTFSDEFQMYSLKILYLNNNNFSDWYEILKLGKCFPMLENLVLSDNPLSNFLSNSTLTAANSFQNLEILILNKLNINEWNVIEQLSDFPSLKHVRIQNVPLLNNYSEEEKYFLVVGHLDDTILSLNGSKITNEDKENCERTFIRYYLDHSEKPKRYFELERRHGKLNKLADINMDSNKKVTCKIKHRDRHILHKVDVRQTVGDFKKQLEKFVGHPSSRFKVFYIDVEACSLSIYGPEELKHANRCLYSFNVVDGDEFEIDLKAPPMIHAATEHQFQRTTTTSQHHQESNNTRQRNISENSSSGETQGLTRQAKKTKPINFFSAHSARNSGKKNESSPVDDFCSLPNNMNKKNIDSLKIEPEKSHNSTEKANRIVFTAGPEINEDILG